LEDTKGVITNSKSMKNRQYNSQNKKNNDLKQYTEKYKIKPTLMTDL